MRERLTGESTEQEDSPKTKSFDKRVTGVLFSLLKRANKIRTAKVSTWEKWIRLLRQQDGKTEDQINGAIAWYAVHLNDDYVPIILNGKQFREKFPQLERLMGRDGSNVNVTPEAAKVAGWLRNRMNWPGDTGSHLEVVIQRSLNNFDKWHSNLIDLRDAIITKPKQEVSAHDRCLLRFINYLKETFCPDREFFVQMWMKEVHQMINWHGWSGSILNLDFRADSKVFERVGREWSMAFSCTPNRWDRLVRALKETE